MKNRPPRLPATELDHEIAQEKAIALGRLGRALERSLAALAAFDAQAHERLEAASERRAERARLVGDACTALWRFVVQREAVGLRDSRQIMRDYRVPPEVRGAMGAFPPRRAPIDNA